MEKERAMEVDVIHTAIFPRHGEHLAGIIRGTLDESVLVVIFIANYAFLLLRDRLHLPKFFFEKFLMYGYYIKLLIPTKPFIF